jgi:hypothetical protein
MGLRQHLSAPAVLLAAFSFAVGCGDSGSSQPTVIVTVEPKDVPSLPIGQTQTFVATVTGTENKVVTWSVAEDNTSGWLIAAPPAGASFTPHRSGTFHVVATSVANANVHATAIVEVPDAALGAAPDTAVVVPPGAALFVPGPAQGGVAWSVLEPDGGSIDQDGRYTAPDREGVYHAVTTSLADPRRTSVVEVTVRADSGVRD